LQELAGEVPEQALAALLVWLGEVPERVLGEALEQAVFALCSGQAVDGQAVVALPVLRRQGHQRLSALPQSPALHWLNYLIQPKLLAWSCLRALAGEVMVLRRRGHRKYAQLYRIFCIS